MNTQLSKLRNEYENYKLKVQHAFKKQKESTYNTVVQSDNQNDIDVQVFRERNDLLIIKLKEERERIVPLERENESLREEFTKSLHRNTKLLGDLKDKETEWRIK